MVKTFRDPECPKLASKNALYYLPERRRLVFVTTYIVHQSHLCRIEIHVLNVDAIRTSSNSCVTDRYVKSAIIDLDRHLMDIRIAEAMLKKFQEKFPKLKGQDVHVLSNGGSGVCSHCYFV